MNIAPVFLFFQLSSCLRMEFGNIEAVGRLQYRKKKISRKLSLIENIVRFNFCIHREWQ